MKYVVTLVHGTRIPLLFWLKARWNQPGSSLWANFADALPGAIVHPFTWSGGNSVAARHRATTDLQDFLRSRLAEYPPEKGARHFVIAHSHGGNIALYALRDPELAQRVSGVACLATPFLYVRRRPYNPSFYLALAVGYPLGVLLPLAQGYNLTDLSSGRAIVLMMLIAVLAVATTVVVSLVNAAWVRLGERVHEHCALPALAPSQLLILRSSGDEASGVLGAFQFASWVISRLWSFLSLVIRSLYGPRLSSWLEGSEQPATRGRWWMRAVPVVFVGIALLAGALVYFGYARAPGVVFAAGIGVVLVLLGPIILLALAWVAAALLWSLLLLPFGLELVVTSPLVETAAETTPPGEWTVLHLAPAERSVAGLRHSSLYDDPRAFAAMTRWMLESGSVAVNAPPG